MKLFDDENRPQGWDYLPATEDLTISQDDLQSMVQSEKFLLALGIAAQRTKDRGLEAGFVVAVNRAKDFLVGEVNIGGTDSMMGHEVIPIDPSAVLRAGVGDLLSLHFHSGDDEDPLPSPSDLEEFMYGTKLIGIGGVDEQGRVKLLLISQNEPIDEYTIADYEESSSSDPLSGVGLNTAQVSFVNIDGSLVPALSDPNDLLVLGEINVKVLLKSLAINEMQEIA